MTKFEKLTRQCHVVSDAIGMSCLRHHERYMRKYQWRDEDTHLITYRIDIFTYENVALHDITTWFYTTLSHKMRCLHVKVSQFYAQTCIM